MRFREALNKVFGRGSRGRTGPVADDFYVHFEDRFRGSEEEIKARLELYVELVVATDPNDEAPILDIGCGRGEWLELLRDHVLPAIGIDINESMVEACRRKGLEAQKKEAVSFLRQRAEGSLSAVTGFHLAEHLPHEELLALLAEAHRVLKPGGVMILETPNPENVVVGACNFYNDPSHIRPIPPEVMEFTLTELGFVNCRIERIHPVKDVAALEIEDPDVRQMAERFFGPQDYYVVGRKGSANAGPESSRPAPPPLPTS